MFRKISTTVPRLARAKDRAKYLKTTAAQSRYQTARYELARAIAYYEPDSAEVEAAAYECRAAAEALEAVA